MNECKCIYIYNIATISAKNVKPYMRFDRSFTQQWHFCGLKLQMLKMCFNKVHAFVKFCERSDVTHINITCVYLQVQQNCNAGLQDVCTQTCCVSLQSDFATY